LRRQRLSNWSSKGHGAEWLRGSRPRSHDPTWPGWSRARIRFGRDRPERAARDSRKLARPRARVGQWRSSRRRQKPPRLKPLIRSTALFRLIETEALGPSGQPASHAPLRSVRSLSSLGLAESSTVHARPPSPPRQSIRERPMGVVMVTCPNTLLPFLRREPE
jgi:hypothetical protein